jgi:peptidoglycan/LPS O-acetylase OafA/YrhL
MTRTGSFGAVRWVRTSASQVIRASASFGVFKKSRSRIAIAFLGRISFALYSSHMLVQGSFTSWLFLLLVERVGYDRSALLATIASLVVMVPAAWQLWCWVDVPAIRLSSWIGVQFLARVESKSKA